MTIEIKLPFKTPTINHLYWHKGNIKIMKISAKDIRQKINEIISRLNIDKEKLLNKKLKVRVEIYENWLTQLKTIKRKDVANREKFLIDSVFNALEIDDKFIFEHNIVKIQNKDSEFAIIKIDEYCSMR